MFAPPPPPSDDETTIISKSDQALEMDTSVAAANSGVVSQAVAAVVNPLNLEETAEDAWMRRARLSGKTNITPLQRYRHFFRFAVICPMSYKDVLNS